LFLASTLWPTAKGVMDSKTIQSRRWIILSVLIISLTAIVLDNTVLNIALKTIAEPRVGLGATQSQLEWAINSYTLVFAGLLFTFGVIGDRIGRRRMLMIGMALFGLSSLLTSYAQTPVELIWARAAMGLGGAAVMPQTLSIITNVFEPRERPRAIGIWAAAVGVAIAVGPIVGGLLLDHFWWGSVFLINVPLTAIGVVAILLLVPESKSPSPGKIDFLGVLLSIAGLILVVYGIIQGGDTGSWLRGDVLGPIAGGLAVLALFAWHETRTDHPSLDVRLFRNPRLSSAATAIAMVFFAMAGVYFFISFYLQNVRGYSPLHAGLLTIPLAAGQLLSSTRSARLVRRFGAGPVCSAGLLTVAAALAGYQLLGTTTPIWVLEVIFFVQGFGMGSVMPPATEAIMSVVPRERGGAGSAITNTARQVAVALGVAVLGSVLAQNYRARLTPDLTALPGPARQAATASITATQALAQRLGPAGTRLVAAADSSFVQAMHVTAVISVVIAVLGAVVMAIWMPRHAAATAAPAASSHSVPAASPAAQAEGVPSAAANIASTAYADTEYADADGIIAPAETGRAGPRPASVVVRAER
jgi:EmrB/QacA subfamily drug resistance transporter